MESERRGKNDAKVRPTFSTATMPPDTGSRLLKLGPDLCTKIACWVSSDDVGDVEDLFNLAATCHSLREVVLRDEVWASLGGENVSTALLQRSNAFSDVARRQLRQLRTYEGADLRHIHLPNLTLLTILSGPCPPLRFGFPRLEKLISSGIPSFFPANLKQLHLTRDDLNPTPDHFECLRLCHGLEQFSGAGLLPADFADHHPRMRHLRWVAKGYEQCTNLFSAALTYTGTGCVVDARVDDVSQLIDVVCDPIEFRMLTINQPVSYPSLAVFTDNWISRHRIRHLKVIMDDDHEYECTPSPTRYRGCTSVTLDVGNLGAFNTINSASMESIKYISINVHRARYSILHLRGDWDIRGCHAMAGTDVVPRDGISM
ncbi:hypothetical protein WJX84_011276 [Apatococcus fuscideae]|uniref:F-box domain-containing protein n=1 Tax=Apatococcus fuscideae TaxID=2026836 RepID=A0AAW1T503_9CHLO